MLPLNTEPASQGTADWRQERAGYVTGTGFQHVLARTKNGGEAKARADYRMRIVTERLTGLPSPEINVPATAWGREHEDEARLAYEVYMAGQGNPVFVQQVGFQRHPTLEWVGASPDGLVGDDGMIEIKCPYNTMTHLTTIISASRKLASALLGDAPAAISLMPEEYYPQVQGNLWVLGRRWCDFISYDPRLPEHLRLYVARIERDEPFIERLEKEVRKFLSEIEEHVAMLLLDSASESAARKEEKVAAHV